MNDAIKLNEVITSIINVLVIPLLPALSAYIIALIKKKTSELESKINSKELGKYIDIAEDTVITAVTAVNQTLVDELKKSNGKLTDFEQKDAFNLAKSKVLGILNHTALKALNEAYNDLDVWLDNRIEYYVNQSKINPEVLQRKLLAEKTPA